MENISVLNDMQTAAVNFGEGALLILAGAGSGKTRVITERIARLIEDKNVAPYQILAITFTNKAAKEMQSRVKNLIGGAADSVWISTFHSFCVRVLRKFAGKIGYTSNFTIYDSGDSKSLIEECIKEAGLSKDYYKPGYVLSEISSAKDALLSPDDYQKEYKNDFRKYDISKVYKLYQQGLAKNNAMDFDDLIFNTLKLFREDPDALEYYQNKFRYVMVDEYQDTAYSQYVLIKLLSGGYGNVCAVGDDDQSIYTWRGADIRNILEFEKDFKDAVIIKLEQNYRSTSNIISAANSVIEHNAGRKKKHLWTAAQSGEKITVYGAENEIDEANFIADRIKAIKSAENLDYSDFALLYRMNSLSRNFESAFVREKIPYKVFGGFKFFDRAEIKDVLAYLRLLDNPLDEISLLRIINKPKRGIGKTTVEKMTAIAAENNLPLLKVIDSAADFEFGSAAAKKLTRFSILIGSLTALSKTLPAKELLEKVLVNTGYYKELKAENTPESMSKLENINELFSVIKEFEASNEDQSLSSFLSNTSLTQDIDAADDSDYVSIMTIHSAKGLEFPVVFLAGAEQEIFPNARALFDGEKLEEERRLCYVAITRAKKRLFITNCKRRMLYGKSNGYLPSVFIDEIAPENVQHIKSQSKACLPEIETSRSLTQKYIEKYRLRKEQEKKTAQPGVKDIALGARVSHSKFGLGSVVAKQGSKYTIVFDKVGIKKIDINVGGIEDV